MIKDNRARLKVPLGSLEVTLDVNCGAKIEMPRAPGVTVRLVNHNSSLDSSAPEGAIYEITAYRPQEEGNYALNGDVPSIYIGKNGIILPKR